jgi:S1-C subfamily serine protease
VRRRVGWTVVSIISCWVYASTAFAAGPFGTIRVGAWSGGAYTDDKTGAFSHCAAITGYANGYALLFGQNAAGSWLIGFAKPKSNMPLGVTLPIDVTFDGQAQFHLFATVQAPSLAVAVLPNNAVVEQLRKAHLMVAVTEFGTSQFELKSTGQLMPVIANCVAKTKSGGVAAAGDFSTLPPRPAASSPVAAAPAPAAAPPKPQKLVEMSGTGIVVSLLGHVVTNYHVISGCVGDINGTLTGQGAAALRIVSGDETNDLALLQAPTSFKETATIRATPIRSGESVIAIGFPYHGLLTSDFTVTTGIISSLSGLLNDTRYLQISAAVQPGNSGGPLLDASGLVIGVVAAKLNPLKFAKATGDLPENINFAIKPGAVRDFLDNSAISYQIAEPKAELKTADIAQSARPYTMLISCKGKDKD